ncbi:MAG: isopentenyl-diphosphate Delta-isomerase [Acidimicrobiales bacterium]
MTRDFEGGSARPTGRVVLVDLDGAVLAGEDKLAAHEAPGQLHLAFSVFLYRPDGKVLLQRRAATKYHFPLHWANACCSHPAPGEDVVSAGERRLVEELGLACALTEAGSFVYRAVCPASGLVEHELDHVLVGVTAGEPVPSPVEVDATCWLFPSQIREGMPAGVHAPWLVRALELAEAARSGAG